MQYSIKAVVFDVNETLSDLGPIEHRFTAVGLPVGSRSAWFASLLRDGLALTVLRQQVRFRDVAADAVAEVVAQSGLTVDAEKLTASVLAGFDDATLHTDVEPGVRLLRSRGLRLATLSNGAVGVAENLLGEAGIRDQFEHVLSTDSVGVWKPFAAPYEYALSKLAISPDEALMVAVHPWDLQGAKAAGLRTAWLNRHADHYSSVFAAPDLTATGVEDLAKQLTLQSDPLKTTRVCR